MQKKTKQKTKKQNLDYQLTPYTRINSKWIKDLNISHDTIKILEENIGTKISDIPHNNVFADISPRESEIKEKNKQTRLHQIQNSSQVKKTNIKMKREPTMGQHICQ